MSELTLAEKILASVNSIHGRFIGMMGSVPEGVANDLAEIQVACAEIVSLQQRVEALEQMLERIADWIEQYNEDPFAAIGKIPDPDKMVAYLRQRLWEQELERQVAAAQDKPGEEQP